jgi:hypothetical protein
VTGLTAKYPFTTRIKLSKCHLRGCRVIEPRKRFFEAGGGKQPEEDIN